MFEKYILVNPERYKASFKQSMSTGKIFFDFSVNASSKKELFNETKDVLEGLTKMYGVSIIISESTFSEAQSGINAREIDAVRVKGKLKPVKIYEPYIDVTEKRKEGYKTFNEGIDLYRRKKFEEALRLFNRVNTVLEGDMPCSLYADRCNELIQNPPGEDWDGVYTAKTK